jgi:hypothetical protein
VEIEPLLIEWLNISKWWPKDFQVMIEFFSRSTIENFQLPNLVTKSFQATTEIFQSPNFLLPKLLIEKLDDQKFAVVIINLTKNMSPKNMSMSNLLNKTNLSEQTSTWQLIQNGHAMSFLTTMCSSNYSNTKDYVNASTQLFQIFSKSTQGNIHFHYANMTKDFSSFNHS